MTFLMQLNMLHKAKRGIAHGKWTDTDFDPAHNICRG